MSWQEGEEDQPLRPLPSLVVKRPLWVYVVTGGYVLLLVAFLAVPLYLFVSANPGNRGAIILYLIVPVGVLLLLGGGLLFTPIRSSAGLPVERTSATVTILSSAFCAMLLFMGGAIALAELFRFNGPVGVLSLIGGAVVWWIWCMLFWWLSQSVDPLTLSDRAYQWLLAGSVLELLVAIQSHIIVRRRNECCGGMMTGLGIITGTALMFIALGPGVYYLFVRRYRQSYARRARHRRNENETKDDD